VVSQTVLRTVGRYEILGEIGRGGMAVAYLARQTDLDRLVALKELAAFRMGDPTVVERFLRESRLTGSLNHPNIVTVHDYFENEGTPYIAMEYFERGSIRPLIRRLTLPQIAGVLDGLLAGLDHAEQRGIVHRDLKPENVMVTTNGSVKIADFGIAKALQDQAVPALTTTDSTVGTPAYMAPEQAMGGAVGAWTDLYAVGIVAYEMLARRLPFDDTEMPMAVLLRHVNEEFPRLDTVDASIDPRVADWVGRMVAKAPEDRPPGALDAWVELEEALLADVGPRWRRDAPLPGDGGATTETSPVPAPASPTKPRLVEGRRWHRLLPLAAVPLLVAGGVALAVALDRSGGHGAAQAKTRQTSIPASTSTVQAAKPAALRSIRATSTADELLLTLVLAGKLPAGSLVVRDRAVADGDASFDLRARGIRSRVHRWATGTVSLQVTTLPGRLRIGLKAPAGRFERVFVHRRGGALLVAFRKPETGPVTTTTIAPQPPPPVAPPSSPPPPPPPPQPPPTQPTSSTTPTETVGG
jgi:hypothetical protein